MSCHHTAHVLAQLEIAYAAFIAHPLKATKARDAAHIHAIMAEHRMHSDEAFTDLADADGGCGMCLFRYMAARTLKAHRVEYVAYAVDRGVYHTSHIDAHREVELSRPVMVAQPVQQAQGKAPTIRLTTEKNGALIRAMHGDRCLAWASAFRIGPCPIFDVFPESGPGIGRIETLKATERKLLEMARARLQLVPVLRKFEAPSDDAFRAAARAAHAQAGLIECDASATVSRSDGQGGAYVALWAWVSDDAAAELMRPGSQGMSV